MITTSDTRKTSNGAAGERLFYEERTDLHQTLGWRPDIIIGRKEKPISCSMRTLYRQIKEKVFDEATLPMRGKRKPNHHQERRGKQAFKRNIAERETDYPVF